MAPMRFREIAVAVLAVAVTAVAGGIVFREAFRQAPPSPSPPLVSSLETGCKAPTDTECVELTNRCHRGREAGACRALERLPHMRTKLENVRRATRSEPGHPAHEEQS